MKWRRRMIWAWAVLSALWCVSVLVPLYSTKSTCICTHTSELSAIEMLIIAAIVVAPPLLVLGAGAAVAWVVRRTRRA